MVDWDSQIFTVPTWGEVLELNIQRSSYDSSKQKENILKDEGLTEQ